MASTPVIDVESILKPISEENPCGEALDRSSPSLDTIVTIRDRAKTSERKLREKRLFDDDESADDSEPIPEPEWKKLIELSVELLTTESKDLRVAAWLAEGLMREHGFVGLRDGIKVCSGLCTEQFWPSIRPVADEFDGHEMTVAQLSGVTGDASLGPLNEIPVTRHGDAIYTMNDYVDAASLDQLDPAAREKKVQAGQISFDKFEQAVRNTESMFYRNLIDDLDELIENLNQMSDFLDQNCQDNQYGEGTSPSVLPLRNRVREIHETIGGLAKDHLIVTEDVVEEGEGAVDGSGQTAVITTPQPAATMGASSVIDRDDAFKALAKIADFFERTEPHSPISHQIRQAVAWGRMSYGELMNELIRDKGALDALFLRVGVPDGSED